MNITNKIDIVYPLGNGSIWNNNEIRYSLRSVEKHLKNYRNIYIIGECPKFLNSKELYINNPYNTKVNSIIYIPHEDLYGHERNIMEKIKAACKIDSISDNFLFINDDHFILKNEDCRSYPYYFRGSLQEGIESRPKDYYSSVLKNTIDALKTNGFNQDHFDIHTPILYNKMTFLETMESYDWEKEYVIKSLYCNSNKITGPLIKDCKIKGRMAAWYLNKKIKGAPVLSIGDKCLEPYPGESESSVKLLLEKLYPHKSKYEL